MATPADRNYSNARRAGRTHPDLVEVIEKNDPRHRSQQFDRGRPSRTMRRHAGFTPGLNGRSGWKSPRKAPGLHPLSMAAHDERLMAELRDAFAIMDEVA